MGLILIVPLVIPVVEAMVDTGARRSVAVCHV